MLNLKPSNEYKKVIIENIVFLRGDDFLIYKQDDPKNDIEYLLQWYYPGEHSTDSYYARDINTAFLGRLIKINGYAGYFLFSKNISLGYMGLARIVRFE